MIQQLSYSFTNYFNPVRTRAKKIWNSWWLPLLVILVLVVGIFYQDLLSAIPKWMIEMYYKSFPSNHPIILTANDTGPIGDTFGGTLGPIIAIIAALLTLLAFWVQYQANIKQREDIKIERFEGKYYEMLRLHRINVDEMMIKKVDGSIAVEKRKCFVSMYNEFRYTFYCCKYVHDELIGQGSLPIGYSDEKLIRLAYIFLYAGVGRNSNMISRSMNVAEPHRFEPLLFEDVLEFLEGIKSKAITKPVFYDEKGNQVRLTIGYKAWGGHQSRLGHYYRHLFQTVKFVVENNIELDDKAILDYLKTLRAQLSDHEQVMLYYNALADFGGKWISNGYFTTYRMIHNIPMPLAHFGITPDIKFSSELAHDAKLFEWLED